MRTFILVIFAVFQLTSFAQVPVSSGSYFQDFGTAAVNSWANNSTYLGWYTSGTFQSHQNITTAPPSNNGGFYSYECNGNGDQKIGSRASGGSGTIRYGVVLQNTTGSAVSHVRVAYKGYQLSLAQNGNTNVITFDYVVGATPPAISASGGTSVTALNFTQLQSNGTSGSAQVQGYPCTQMANMQACITVSIPNNSYILLRWTDVDDSGNDHHMAIDDVDVQFLATNLSASSATICAGQSATLTANGASSYTWSPAANLSAGTGSVVVANPTTTTTYTISGSVSSCPSKTLSTTVTVNATAQVSVTSQTVCSGTAVTLTASGATSYTWSPAAGLSATTGSAVTANPSSTTVYTVTSPGGSCPTTPGMGTVTVLPSATISAVSQSICSGASATLSASGATSYTWSPAASLNAATGPTVSANPSSTLVYTVSGSNGSCAAAPATVTLTVLPNPTVSVNSASICPSTSTALTASGAASYSWSPATGLSVITGANVSASPATTAVYTITGDLAGCTASTTATVTVLSAPLVSVNSASICNSGSATLNASGANSYTWSPSTGLSSTAGSSVNANPGNTMVYTVTGAIGSCTASATSTVVVAPVQSAAFNYPATSYCTNSASAIPSISGATGGIFTSSSSLLQLDQATGIINISHTIPDTYTVTYTTQGACPDAQSFALQINPAPVLTVGSATACAGQSATLAASTSVGGGSFNWQPGNSSGPSLLVTAQSSADYTVTYTFNGCSDTRIAKVAIIAGPDVSITPSSASPILEEQQVTLLASGGDTYVWDNGQTGNTLVTEPKETTEYCVSVTSVQGCKNRACITMDLIRPSTLYIPNTFTPNGDGLNDLFVVPHSNITEFRIRIFDRWGALLFESSDINTSWDGTYKGKAVADDVYVYSLSAKGEDKQEFFRTGHVTVMH